MDEPPSKRRRTSQSGAATSDDAPPTPSRAATTPERRTTPRSKRPSFASPTKASLARHNPQILERRRSNSPSKVDSPRPSAIPRPSAGARPTRRQQQQQPGATTENVAASEIHRSDIPEEEEDDDEDEMSRAEEGAPSSGPAVRRARGGLAAAPRRSPAKPNPRPFPPPGPEGEDELSPFVGRAAQRQMNTGVPTRRPEPELPPSVPDPVASSSPKGIHSSPTKWRDVAQAKKSSPLKLAAESPSKTGQPRSTSFLRRLQRRRDDEADEPDPLLDQTTHPARKVPAPDSHAGKKRERDTLREELAKLKKDLDIIHRENDRIRLMQSSGRTVAGSNDDAVLDIMKRYLLPKDANEKPAVSQQLMQALLNPSALFTLHKAPQVITTQDPDNLADVKSHHPVEMTAEEELPFLQLFSPFELSSSVTMLPTAAGQPLRQRHSIDIRSSAEPGFFSAKVEMIVNAMNLEILELRVPKLHPAATKELMPFINQVCAGDCNRSMERNVGILAWAMGEWHRVSEERAVLWHRLESELGTKEGVEEMAEKMRAKRARAARHADDDDDEDDERGLTSDHPAPKRADVLRLIGEQSFEIEIHSLSRSPATLRVQWKIGFDWTGEAQSELSVNLGAPGKWFSKDKKGALGDLPKLFGDLIKGGEEPAEAVRTVVALLAGEGGE